MLSSTMLLYFMLLIQEMIVWWSAHKSESYFKKIKWKFSGTEFFLPLNLFPLSFYIFYIFLVL